MTPTRFLIGQIAIVFAVVIGGLWFATQWAATELAFQPRLGAPWFVILAWPVYYPWRLFEWWYAYDAYAPEVFEEAGTIAAMSGFAGCAVAIVGSLWRARQSRLVTTYGSSRWASTKETERWPVPPFGRLPRAVRWNSSSSTRAKSTRRCASSISISLKDLDAASDASGGRSTRSRE